ncbi:MAG TPA: DUF4252 domain-containing protein [Cyclobacteriaceae bacterium]|nr:DUF4252 domain-containing protein [Cyclobacteriaceae bacterium]
MKKILTLLCLTALTLTAQAQSKSVEALYNKYKSNKDFFHMDLAGNFLDLAKGMNLKFSEVDLEAMTKSVDRVKLFKLPVKGSEARADFRSLQKGLEKEKYELMMELSEKGSGIVLYTKGGNLIKDMIILISGEADSEPMVLALEGEFDAKFVSSAMP